jgi:hypothetical protein
MNKTPGQYRQQIGSVEIQWYIITRGSPDNHYICTQTQVVNMTAAAGRSDFESRKACFRSLSLTANRILLHAEKREAVASAETSFREFHTLPRSTCHETPGGPDLTSISHLRFAEHQPVGCYGTELRDWEQIQIHPLPRPPWWDPPRSPPRPLPPPPSLPRPLPYPPPRPLAAAGPDSGPPPMPRTRST